MCHKKRDSLWSSWDSCQLVRATELRKRFPLAFPCARCGGRHCGAVQLFELRMMETDAMSEPYILTDEGQTAAECEEES